MKYLKYFIILLLIPFIVLAEECDISKITITSIEEKSIEGNTEVISEPTFEGRNINLNLKMFEVEDSITYDMTIKNASEEDYMIDENTFKTDSEYIEYTLKTNDNSNVVKSQSSKDVSLTVTYKKEVDDNLLNNNKFDASNNLKLSLNTNDKEKPLDTIVTDNIKESVDPIKVTNPQTESSNIKLIVAILVLVTIIIMFTIYSKKQYIKYSIILIPLFIIPMVYAICKCDIEVNSTIEIEKQPKLSDKLKDISQNGNSCIKKYFGYVTDETNNTKEATNVYFDTCEDQRNVIFANYCWEIIRTTETGGTKLIYNGEPVDGKCENTRGTHKGIIANSQIITLNSDAKYGSSFTYDRSNDTFTLINPETATWSDSTCEDLIGKFTCNNNSGSCSTLYSIRDYYSNTHASTNVYTLDNVSYYLAGKSPIYTKNNSPAYLGFMYNKVYESGTAWGLNDSYLFGSSYTYDNNTGVYQITGGTITINEWANEYQSLTTQHYTCWDESTSCSDLSYVYHRTNNKAYYIDLVDGDDIEVLIEEMLHDENVNKTDSILKHYLESWYMNNLEDYTDKIENNVYCNNRDIIRLNIFDKTSPFTNNTNSLDLKEYDYSTHIECNRITDQFSVSNPKAKLKKSIGLITSSEAYNLVSSNYLIYNDGIWYLSPASFFSGTARFRYTGSNAAWNFASPTSNNGVRPSISLKSNVIITSGTGSETDPWIIK